MSESDGTDFAPNQRTFGAGLKRKRIEFVPAATPSLPTTLETNPHHSLSDRYLSITLKNCASQETSSESARPTDLYDEGSIRSGNEVNEGAICNICHMPVRANSDKESSTLLSHDVSLAHQICVEHSYPPSHLDRARQGLKYLSSYGWDPDSRLGLGASGAGIRVPIKVAAKHDTVGLGVKLPEGKQHAEKVIQKLDAKAVRKLEAKNKKKRDMMQQVLFGNNDLEKYLGF